MSISTASSIIMFSIIRSSVAIRTLAILIIAAQALFIGGCAVSYYPTTMPVPFFTDEGQVHAGVYYGFTGVEAQAAVSPARNFFVAAAGAYDKTTKDLRSESVRYGEIGAGFYITTRDDFRFEGILGGGIGSTVGYNDSLLDGGGEWIRVDASYQRIFLQTNGGISIPLDSKPGPGNSGAKMELGITNRFSYVHPSRYLEDGVDQDNMIDLVFMEPGLFGRVGTGTVQGELQFGLSFPFLFISDSFLEEQRPFAWQPYFGSIGLRVFFGRGL